MILFSADADEVFACKAGKPLCQGHTLRFPFIPPTRSSLNLTRSIIDLVSDAGLSVWSTTCGTCGRETKSSPHRFYDLQLPLEIDERSPRYKRLLSTAATLSPHSSSGSGGGTISLEGALKALLAKEEVDGYVCEGCNEKSTACRALELTHLPPILHLQVFLTPHFDAIVERYQRKRHSKGISP